jgi:hypothetical protein
MIIYFAFAVLPDANKKRGEQEVAQIVAVDPYACAHIFLSRKKEQDDVEYGEYAHDEHEPKCSPQRPKKTKDGF